MIGEAILVNLQNLVTPQATISPPMAVGAPTPPDSGGDDGPDAGAVAALSQGGWHLTFRFKSDALRNGTNPLALMDELRDLGSCTVTALLEDVPPLAASRGGEPDPVQVPQEVVPPAPEATLGYECREAPRRAENRPASSVRVPAERLDELMDQVGELVIAQARLSQLAHGRIDPNVKAVAEEIDRLAAGLRDITST